MKVIAKTNIKYQGTSFSKGVLFDVKQEHLNLIKDHVEVQEDNMTLKEIKLALDEKGIEYKANAKKEELLAILQG